MLRNQSNFRDLGGVSTQSGQKIKKGRIFRSGELSELDEHDLSVLEDLNIGKILDLRTVDEIDLQKNGQYPNSIDYQNVPINAGNITQTLIPIFQKGTFNLIDPQLLEKIYFDVITEFKTELSSVYKTIIHADQAVLYHCSHGKDRTGIVSALLLDFFGIDREYIYTDYLMSNELLKRRNEYQLQMIKAKCAERFDRVISDEEFAPVTYLFYCRKEYLKAVFDYVDEHSGNVHNYFRKELGLSDEELELLKTNYLE